MQLHWQPTAFVVFRYSLKGVEKAIAAGHQPVFEDALPTQYDRFFDLAGEMGVLDGFLTLTDLRKDPAVPLSALCVLMMCRFLRCLKSFREMGELLLRYQPLLERLGFTVQVCAKGVYLCARTRQPGAEEGQKVFDEEVFSEVLRNLDREELNRLLSEFIKVLRKRYPGLFTEGVFAMDSNHYRLVGSKEERKWCALMLLTRYGLIPVAMEFSATEGEGTGETSVGRRVLERALQTYGAGMIRVLLMDAGYIDGATEWWLKKEQGIDWVTRSKEGMRATRYLEGIAMQAPAWRWHKVRPPQLGLPAEQLPRREILWVEEVPSLPGYESLVNGCVLRDTYPPSEEHPEGKVEYQYLIASNLGWKGAEIHALWRRRWSIENAFGFMTEAWGLGKWQIRNGEVYEATIQFMVLTYGLHILLQVVEQKPRTLAQVKRRFERQQNMVIIRAGEYCAVLTTKTLNDWLVRGVMTLRAP